MATCRRRFSESKYMSDFPKVSVIIPVWNPGPGICRCIESLRGQTLEDIEMIFVDDCGTDGAMDVVRAAATEDPRIRIITNAENLGPGPSRNAGIEAARGAYLAFVDSDDYVDTAFLERLYAKAIADQLDIVKGKMCYIEEDGTKAEHVELNDIIREGIQLGEPLFVLFRYQHKTAIYRRAFVKYNDIRYGSSRRAQDITFLLKACHKAKSFGLEETAEYYFCERSGSLMHDTNPRTLERSLHAFQEQMDYIVGNMADEDYASLYVSVRLSYNLRLCNYWGKRQECGDAANRFAIGFREQVLRFPQLEKLESEAFIVRVLCDYGVALARRPFILPWETHQSERYVEILQEWVDFIEEHPRCSWAAEKTLLLLYDEAESLCISENTCLPSSLVSDIEEICRRNKEKVALQYSIIIPHKDIPDLLQRCLNSIPLRDDVQVIVVDDNSDPRKVDFNHFPQWEGRRYEYYLTKEGKGAGYARNIGLDHAKGRWIVFADADDFFSQDFNVLLDEMVDAEEDLIYFDYINVLSDDITQQVTNRIWYRQYIASYLEGEASERVLRVSFPVIWCRIIKRSFIKRNKIRFSETRWGNDVLFSALIGSKAKTIKASDKIGYVVTTREGSLTDDLCSTSKEFRVRMTELMKCDDVFAPKYGPDARSIPFLMGLYNRKGIGRCVRLCLGNVFYPKIFWKAFPFFFKRVMKNGLR